MKFSQFMSYYKRKKISINFTGTENQFEALLCLQRIKRNLYWEIKLLKQATYVRHALPKL